MDQAIQRRINREHRSADATKRSQQNSLLTFICMIMTCGPPLFALGGVYLYEYSMIKRAHAAVLEEFNGCVREWNRPSRTMEAFTIQEFYVNLDPDGNRTTPQAASLRMRSIMLRRLMCEPSDV